MRNLFRGLCLFVTGVALAAGPANKQPTREANPQSLALVAGQGTFLILSDIHFDPFANRTLVPQLISADVARWQSIFDSARGGGFSQYGQDTNYALLRSLLEAARRYQSAYHYDYVVVTGDYLAHKFRERYLQSGCNDASYPVFVVKTMTFLTRMIQKTFPSLAVFGAVGNNDSICGDYSQTPGDELLRSMAEEWRVLARVPEARADFAVGGFYAVSHPTVANRELIVLNTTFWSNLYKDSCSAVPGSPGKAELQWFAWKLYQAQAQTKTVSLIMHIPPGIDSYNSAKLAKCSESAPLWNPEFASQFERLVDQFRALLRDVYVGHLHMDDFRVFEDAQGSAFAEAHVVPAVSPIYDNNPAFEIALYDKHTGNLVNYAIVYLTDLAQLQKDREHVPTWRIEYSADAAYRVAEYGPTAAKQIAGAIRSDTNTRRMFATFYNVTGSHSSPVATDRWLSFACAQTEWSAEGYAQCSCSATAAPEK
jgi:sphingomyelin phosphodiesterase acid-like 3